MRGVYPEDTAPTHLHRHTPNVMQAHKGKGGNASTSRPGATDINSAGGSARGHVQKKRSKRR